jgi:hypothetical protein
VVIVPPVGGGIFDRHALDSIAFNIKGNDIGLLAHCIDGYHAVYSIIAQVLVLPFIIHAFA